MIYVLMMGGKFGHFPVHSRIVLSTGFSYLSIYMYSTHTYNLNLFYYSKLGSAGT